VRGFFVAWVDLNRRQIFYESKNIVVSGSVERGHAQVLAPSMPQ